MIAALYVETGGCYYGLPDVDPWDKARDARTYAGPWPVVAHPPCERWGRYWHGSPRKPHQYELGADEGCFEAALWALLRYGGVLEHPAQSKAWDHFNLPKPDGEWRRIGRLSVCHVEQGHYGHMSRKSTWLLGCDINPPALLWGTSGQRLHPVAVARHGYEKARRIGMSAMVGGKHKTAIRAATPPAFRDLLISIAKGASPCTPSDAATISHSPSCSPIS